MRHYLLTRAEILFTCKLACRGAGFDWGLSNIAAKATLSLIENGQDGFAILLEVLDHAHGKPQPKSISPNSTICGLTLGAYLSDMQQGAESISDKVVGVELARAIIENLPVTSERPDSFPPALMDYFQLALVPESEMSRRQGAGEG